VSNADKQIHYQSDKVYFLTIYSNKKISIHINTVTVPAYGINALDTYKSELTI